MNMSSAEIIVGGLLMIAMLAVAGTLLAGLLTMARRGRNSEASDRREQSNRSNAFMRARVKFQALALVLFALLLLLQQRG